MAFTLRSTYLQSWSTAGQEKEGIAAENLLLPENGLLLHIGPHKTGTTAIQGAFHLARERLAARGVFYPGRGRQPLLAVLAVTGQPALLGEGRPSMKRWDGLAAALRARDGQRVVLSSEFFAEANDAEARRVVEDLGGPRAHVVVTLRPLTRILPSQWQQYIQNGYRMPYVEWLDGILSDPPHTPTPGFWVRHRHDTLVARWAGAAGPANVTVIVVDERDRSSLLRTFEAMLGLPRGFLVPEDDTANRSLTRPEAELVRRLNEEFTRREWPDRDYAKFVRYGAVQQMKSRQPPPGEPKITMPGWALERAAAIGAEMADNIAGLGVRVIGDIASLGKRPESAAGGDTDTAGSGTDTAGADTAGGDTAGSDAPAVPSDAAVQAMLGAFMAGGAGSSDAADIMRDVDTKSITRVLMQRGRHKLGQALHLTSQ